MSERLTEADLATFEGHIAISAGSQREAELLGVPQAEARAIRDEQP